MSKPINFDEVLQAVKRQDAIETEFNGEVGRLAAEVDRLRTEHQAILDAGGDFLWAGGAKTLPEAVAGALHALDVALTRSAKEYDRSPTAKARETIPSLTLTDADVVRRAVEQAGRLEYLMRRVSAVDAALSCGSDVAAAICRACGLDPDEMVGDDGEGEG